MMGTTEKAAKFIADFDFEAIPSKGFEQIEASIVDSMNGCRYD